MPRMRRFVRKFVLSLAIATVFGTAYLANTHDSHHEVAATASMAVADDFNWN